MSSESDAFARQVLGVRDDLSFAASLAYLRQTAGSGRGAARLAGVGEASLRDWATGRHPPSARNQSRIVAAVRDLRTPPPGSDGALQIKVAGYEPRRRQTRRERKPIGAQQLQLQPGTLAASRAAYLTGGSGAAMKTFLKGVGNDVYRKALTPAPEDDEDTTYEYDEFASDYGLFFI